MTPPVAGLAAPPSSGPTEVGLAPGVGFATALADHGERPALIDHDGTAVTYAALAGRVAATAATLGSTRRLVLVEGAHTLDTIVTYLAALAGGHPVLLAPAGRPDLTRALADAYRPDVVGTDSDGGAIHELRAGAAHDLHPDLALLLTTSGTTGSPKLVRLSRTNVEANAAAIATVLGLGPDDRGLTSLPLHYCYGLSVLHSHLAVGAAMVLTDLSVTDPCFWTQFREARVSSLAGVPYTFAMLERVGFADMDLPHLRSVTQAGGRLAPDRVCHWAEVGGRRGWDLHVMYGQTEATARMACLPPDQALRRPHSVGLAIPGGSFAIERPREATAGAGPGDAGPFDAEPGDAGPDGVGELVYRGPNVMLGYAETAADLALGRTVHELRTGDRARIDADGFVEIVGRTSRFAKPFGLRVDLDRCEQFLAERGLDAVCVGDDDRLIVAVEAEVTTGGPSEQHPALGGLADTLGLPRPAVVLWVTPWLPRLASGKPHLAAITAAATAPSPAVGVEPAATAPSTPGSVAAVMAEALDRPIADVTPAATFVSLGGDSLSYVEVSVALDDLLDRVPTAWHLTPVAELEARVVTRVVAPGAGSTGATEGTAATPTTDHDAPKGASHPSRSMETNVVLRAAAIVAIVATHSGAVMLQGGAHVLLAVAGYNYARFRLLAADTAGHLRGSASSVARIAVPTAIWLAFQFTYAEPFTAPRVLFVNNYLGSGLWEYWYLEALLQILVVLAVAFAFPGVRAFERRHRFGVAMGVLAAATALRFDALDIGSSGQWMYRPDTIVWCFALGWAAQRAATIGPRAIVTVVGLVCVVDFFDSSVRGLAVAVGLALLLWLPRLPVPHTLRPAVAALAAASLWIYLTHWAVLPPLRGVLPPVAVVAVALAVGVLAAVLGRRVERRWLS